MKQKLFSMFLAVVGLIVGINSGGAATYTWVHGDNSSTLSVAAAKGEGSANTYSGYTISYGGATYTTCVKMESATTLTFTTANAATITVVEALKNGNTYSDASKTALSLQTNDGTAVVENSGITSSTAGNSTENGLEVVFSNVAAGTQVIKRAGSELGVFLIKVEEIDANAVSTPTINAVWGSTYGASTSVSITSATNGATIYYTIDGSTPTTSSTEYTSSFSVSENCTVKAIAVKSGLTNSQVASQAVTINNNRTIAFDFSGVTLTQGSAPVGSSIANGTSYTLPNGRLYYIEGKTQTGWSDGTETYLLGANVTIDKDFTFSPVFADNTVALGDAAATVNWTFATSNGAPTAGLEGNIGYYATQTTVNNTLLDVVMTINTTLGAAIENKRGKWNTASNPGRAQVNMGTLFTIPAIKGMVVTYTATNGSPTVTDFSFAGENASSVSNQTVTYTYNGTDATIDIVEKTGNFYPSGISVAYPAVAPRQASDLTLTSSNAVSLDANTTTSQITATTSATVGLTYTSSNPTVATVSSTGLITAVANGTATITVAQVGDATYMDDSKTVTVTVNNGVSASYSIAAILNNENGTMLTSAETAAQGNAVSFGINAAGERVAADAADAVVTISGNYYNDQPCCHR